LIQFKLGSGFRVLCYLSRELYIEGESTHRVAKVDSIEPIQDRESNVNSYFMGRHVTKYTNDDTKKSLRNIRTPASTRVQSDSSPSISRSIPNQKRRSTLQRQFLNLKAQSPNSITSRNKPTQSQSHNQTSHPHPNHSFIILVRIINTLPHLRLNLRQFRPRSLHPPLCSIKE
jgi:hypothetical protein